MKNEPIEVKSFAFTVDNKKLFEKVSKFQFDNPYNYVRELVQNSLDAIDVKPSRIDIHQDKDSFSIEDDGTGITRKEIDEYLFKIFSSNKRSDATKIGQFGIGLYSVFALKPQRVIVETGKDGESWKVVINHDCSVEYYKGGKKKGTKITIEKSQDIKIKESRRNKFLRKLKFIDSPEKTRLLELCRYIETPIYFNRKKINKKMDIEDALIKENLEKYGLSGMIGIPEEPINSIELYKGRIYITTKNIDTKRKGVKAMVDSPEFNPVLSRNDVKIDRKYKAIMKKVDETLDDLYVKLIEKYEKKGDKKIRKALLSEIKHAGPRKKSAFEEKLYETKLFKTTDGIELSLKNIGEIRKKRGRIYYIHKPRFWKRSKGYFVLKIPPDEMKFFEKRYDSISLVNFNDMSKNKISWDKKIDIKVDTYEKSTLEKIRGRLSEIHLPDYLKDNRIVKGSGKVRRKIGSKVSPRFDKFKEKIKYKRIKKFYSKSKKKTSDSTEKLLTGLGRGNKIYDAEKYVGKQVYKILSVGPLAVVVLGSGIYGKGKNFYKDWKVGKKRPNLKHKLQGEGEESPDSRGKKIKNGLKYMGSPIFNGLVKSGEKVGYVGEKIRDAGGKIVRIKDLYSKLGDAFFNKNNAIDPREIDKLNEKFRQDLENLLNTELIKNYISKYLFSHSRIVVSNDTYFGWWIRYNWNGLDTELFVNVANKDVKKTIEEYKKDPLFIYYALPDILERISKNRIKRAKKGKGDYNLEVLSKKLTNVYENLLEDILKKTSASIINDPFSLYKSNRQTFERVYHSLDDEGKKIIIKRVYGNNGDPLEKWLLENDIKNVELVGRKMLWGGN